MKRRIPGSSTTAATDVPNRWANYGAGACEPRGFDTEPMMMNELVQRQEVLMVLRDLDVTVTCPDLGVSAAEAVARLGACLAVHPRVRRAQFRDDALGSAAPWGIG